MELADLRVFVRIAKTRNLSAAARALHLPKSSLSRALARLEGAVGAVVIERSTRHLRLTDAGAMLLPHALRLLDGAEEAQASLDGLVEVPRGTIKISVTHSFAVGVLTPMLAGFLRRYPELRVVLDIGNRSMDLTAEGIDLAICIGPPGDSGLIGRRLAVIQLWICASPDYLHERGTPKTTRDLAKHTLISRADHVLAWRFYSAAGKMFEVEVLPATVIPEPAATVEVLIRGGGIGRIPEYLAAQPIVDGKLVRLLPTLRPEMVEVHAVYPRSLTAKTRVFIEALSEHLHGGSEPLRRPKAS